ncbi:MAG: hypothetical protein ACWGSQ_03680 [Longimicrobiales bacterium]
MILRLYGTSYQSVQPNLNSRAFTEIGFLKDGAFSISVDEFTAAYEKVEEKSFSPQTTGAFQDQAETELLDALKAEVLEAVAELRDGEVLVVENRDREDRPKTKDVKKNIVVNGESRLHFFWRVEPPLRLGVYRPRA